MGKTDKLIQFIDKAGRRRRLDAGTDTVPPIGKPTDIKELGSGVIRGVECDHLAFRTREVDWQIWIAQGKEPYPCRYVITSSKVAGAPEYSLAVWSWKTGAGVVADPFKVDIPSGAQELTPEKVQELGDIPGIFKAAINPER